MESALSGLLASELTLAGIATAVAVAAVWPPFIRGVTVALRARRATRPLDPDELRKQAAEPAPPADAPVSVLMLRALQQSEDDAGPEAFLADAAREYAMGAYDAHYGRRLSMYANLLPPIGFIGTTCGLLALFLSLHLAEGSLELPALAVALTSTILALVAFAVLEGCQISLYARLIRCLDDVARLPEAPLPLPRPTHGATIPAPAGSRPRPASERPGPVPSPPA